MDQALDQADTPPAFDDEPKPDEVLLDVLFPSGDALGGTDTQPSFFRVAVEPPPGNDAVINAVPEPGLLSLLGAALFGLVAVIKRNARC